MEKKFETRDIQLKLLPILVYIDKVCKENNLRYWLGFGTLIGAIRHHGFIPWDDDVDIYMPRKDYIKLMEIIDKDNSRFKAVSIYNDPKWYHPRAKVYDTTTKLVYPFLKDMGDIGLFVDIFPLDGVPNDLGKLKIAHKYAEFARGMAASANRKCYSPKERYVALKKILKPFALINGPMFWAKQANDFKFLMDFDESEYIWDSMNDCGKDPFRPLKREWFETIDWDFEGYTFNVPAGYDPILRQLYGDYMQLPPEDQRHSVHIFDIVDLGED